ncbi:putative hemolysin-iii channel protein [Botrytis fragariae]|uniref:Putative hemolysin-iii channel protein n=1 Tax=Botrytis fragariae TaxID=1964551 RepID=A0A8H6ASH8_9HELO|nr:putative hemolysin-iii channel protein [Botrytis fragariae]KAF5872796.1 putative hemolysin-iii channel protein [Botrytis fragariae]
MMEKSKLPDSALPNFRQLECEKPPSPLTCQQDSTSTSHKGLITYDDLPPWHQDNPSIFTSYRPITHSLRDSLRTFFTLHNETLNIHTHSIPFLTCFLLTGLIFYIFSIHFPESPLVDRFIFSIFFLTTMICMGFSMGYHTLLNHSKGVAEIWLKLDFLGIVVAILGDFVTGIYVAFYCEWRFQVGYWVMVGTGCSAFAPIIHAIVYFGWDQVVDGTGMPWYLGEGGFLVLGAVVYSVSFLSFFYFLARMLLYFGSEMEILDRSENSLNLSSKYINGRMKKTNIKKLRIPECYFPGKFDIIGHSHQIFHILVVAASGMHLVGLLKAYEHQYYYPRCAMR